MMRANGTAGRIGGIMLFCATATIVRAQALEERIPVEPAAALDPGALLKLPYSTRLALDAPSWAAAPGPASAVLTQGYRARVLEEKAWHEAHFGVHPMGGAAPGPYLVRETPVAGHPGLNFVQELHWPGARPLAGLQFERKDLLFKGDQLSIRSTSDLQTLARGIGLSGSDTEAGMLSLLGWRSHSRVLWQWGEPTRELQWRFSAGLDRRAATQRGTLNLQMVRRF